MNIAMPNLTQSLNKLLRRHYTDHTPGAVLLLAQGGQSVYQGSAGMAELGTKHQLGMESNFRLASVSKQFTAMCVHLLAQQGQLQPQEDLHTYFPELSHFRGIKLLHLLNHSSGLPDFENNIPASQSAQLTDEQVLSLIAAQPAPLFAAGTAYRYSNTAYVLLGLLVERVAGIAFEEFLEREIFKPLQMHHSCVYASGRPIHYRAYGYTSSPSGFTLSDQNIGTATRGDGCIYTSASNYLKWHNAISQENLLFNITNQLENSQTSIDAAKAWGYSYGWFCSSQPGTGMERCHSGDTSGFTNLVLRLPRQDTLVLCLSNIRDNWVFMYELLEALKPFPDFCPSSELVRHLPQLTR